MQKFVLALVLLLNVIYADAQKIFTVSGDLSGCLSAYQEGSKISALSLMDFNGSEYSQEYKVSLSHDGTYHVKGYVSEPAAVLLEVVLDVPGGTGRTRLPLIVESGDIVLNYGHTPHGTPLNESVFKEISTILNSGYDEQTLIRKIEKSSDYAKTILRETSQQLKKNIERRQRVSATSAGGMYVDFEGRYDGSPVRLSDYVGKGKYVVVDFWASWCGPCRQKIPELIELYEKYKDQGLEIVGVSVSDKPENSMRVIERMGIPYPQIFDVNGEAVRLYSISTIPELVLISPQGKIMARGNIDLSSYLSEIF